MPPADDRTRPYALQPGQGWTYRFGIDFTVKAGEVAPGSGVAVTEYTTRAGEEPGDHTHPTEDEIFYVLQGAITFRCAGQTFDLEAGGLVFLPRGLEHGYTLTSAAPVRLLVITAPVRDGHSGGWGGFISDLQASQGELMATPPHPDFHA